MSVNSSEMTVLTSVATSDMDTSISPSSPTSSGRQTLAVGEEEHPRYHFYDGSLAFQLEGLKYRIHGSLLARHCAFTSTWAADLRDPAATGISCTDLDVFLSMIYLATYETLSLSLSVKEWISLLHLATRWKADGMRALAINILAEKAPALDKLVLCRTYDVPAWLAPACASLALRPTALSIEEAEKLEKSDIVRVFLAREAVSKGEVDAVEAAVSSWLATSPPSPPPPTTGAQSGSQAPPTDPAEVPDRPNTEMSEISPSSSAPNAVPSAEATASVRREAPQSLLPSPTLVTGSNRSDTTEPLLPSRLAASPPASSRRLHSDDKQVNEFITAIRAKRYDYVFALSWNKNQADPVAREVASSFVSADGTVANKDLQSLSRAAIRRAVRQPGYIPITSQLLAALSTNLPRGIFESLLHDDMQSLSSRWSAFRAGATPATDHGGFMDDLATHSREVYQQQMGNGKGLFRSLVRLGVLSESDQWVSLLIK